MRRLMALATGVILMLAMQSCASQDARRSSDGAWLEEHDIYVPWWSKEPLDQDNLQ